MSPRDTICDIAPELSAEQAVAIAAALTRERLVGAREVAKHLGLRKTDWVYANAARIGGLRLGEGPKAHWRFYLSEVDAALRATPEQRPAPEQKQKKPRRAPGKKPAKQGMTRTGHPLLSFKSLGET